jgi:hypothetical protein
MKEQPVLMVSFKGFYRNVVYFNYYLIVITDKLLPTSRQLFTDNKQITYFLCILIVICMNAWL